MEDKFDSTPQEPTMHPMEAPTADTGNAYSEKPALPPEAMLTPPPRLQPSYISAVQQKQTSATPVIPPDQIMTPPAAPPVQPLTPPVAVQPFQSVQPLTEAASQPAKPQPSIAVPEMQPLPLPGEQPQQQSAPPVPTVQQQQFAPPTPTVPQEAPAEGFRQPTIAGQPEAIPQYGGPAPANNSVSYRSDYERIMALPPISKQEAESCRHSHEKRWYRRLIEINILAIIAALILIVAHSTDYKLDLALLGDQIFSNETSDEIDADTDSEKNWEEQKAERKKEKEMEREQTETMQYYMNALPPEIKILLSATVGLLITFFSLYLYFANLKASSVKITQNNFPEIYSLIHSYAYRLGMKKVPEAYIMQQNGVLNALSSFLFGRQYIMINSEVFEVAYREHKDMNALAFIIGHETAHIYYGHSTMHYNLPIILVGEIPLFGAIASRTREYSCDRLAQRLTNYDGVQAMIMLMVDRHLYPMVDVQDYINTTINDRGFCLWLINLLADHPIMPKRIRALIQWNGSGELY